MNEKNSADNGSETKKKSKFFAFKRLAGGLVLLIAALWILAVVLGYFRNPFHPVAKQDTSRPAQHSRSQKATAPAKAQKQAPALPANRDKNEAVVHAEQQPPAAGQQAATDGSAKGHLVHSPANHPAGEPREQATKNTGDHHVKNTGGHRVTMVEKPAQPESFGATKPVPEHSAPKSSKIPATHPVIETTTKTKPVGVAFVEATIQPLDYELNERFWGWRPNDIINITDNINNFQLGVLEVTRRTAVVLSERISRTGTNDALDPNLENAMNWFMIKADRYWFPSAESKYKEGLKELAKYKEKLMEGRAKFYTRSDSLIPLLSSYEDLLGSCDENLVKAFEEDGSPVSFFKADDYVYYARGVASAMLTILEAVGHEYISILESRHGTELLHHAIESCKRAVEIDPIMVINSELDGIFANHRANMAAPISHARFYLGQLIKTLST